MTVPRLFPTHVHAILIQNNNAVSQAYCNAAYVAVLKRRNVCFAQRKVARSNSHRPKYVDSHDQLDEHLRTYPDSRYFSGSRNAA